MDFAGGPYKDEEKRGGKNILCLLLVASRDIENEEVLFNYRLSPGAEKPDWYTTVDHVEEKRRWA